MPGWFLDMKYQICFPLNLVHVHAYLVQCLQLLMQVHVRITSLLNPIAVQ